MVLRLGLSDKLRQVGDGLQDLSKCDVLYERGCHSRTHDSPKSGYMDAESNILSHHRSDLPLARLSCAKVKGVASDL